jgi:AcrR family transcriptional regulator
MVHYLGLSTPVNPVLGAIAMADRPQAAARSAEVTKARIIDAAQRVFSQKGYSQAGLREIARNADVGGSLIIKYFETKANLFEEALTRALIDPQFFQSDRSKFGKSLVETLNSDSQPLLQPPMIALSIGDDEAKTVIARVSQKFVLDPMAQWLGGTDGIPRAKVLLMLAMGYLILARHIGMSESKTTTDKLSELVAQAMQAIVDGR